MADTPNEIAQGTPINDNLALINQNFQSLNDENRTKIVKNGTTPVLLMGYQKDGFGAGIDYGFKVAKPGYDVTTAAAANLSFNSAYNSFKIVATGTVSLPAVAAGTTDFEIVTHNLGFAPANVGYLTDAGGTFYSQLPVVDFVISGANDGKVKLFINATVTPTNYQTQFAVATLYTLSGPYIVRYYLLQETAS